MVVRVSTTDQVHARLREATVTGELEAGSRHSAYRLADGSESPGLRSVKPSSDSQTPAWSRSSGTAGSGSVA